MLYRLAVHLMFAAKGFLAVYSEFALRFGGCGAVEHIILYKTRVYTNDFYKKWYQNAAPQYRLG